MTKRERIIGKTFFVFLQRNRLDVEFMREVMKRRRCAKQEAFAYVIETLGHYNPEAIIDNALTWSSTARGSNFWASMNQEWARYYLRRTMSKTFREYVKR